MLYNLLLPAPSLPRSHSTQTEAARREKVTIQRNFRTQMDSLPVLELQRRLCNAKSVIRKHEKSIANVKQRSKRLVTEVQEEIRRCKSEPTDGSSSEDMHPDYRKTTKSSGVKIVLSS
jgi:hypothetical protein